MKLNLVKTTRGNTAVWHDGFMFRKDVILKSGLITWRCMSRGCKSSIKTDITYTLVKDSIHTHNHSPPRQTASSSVLSSPSLDISSPKIGNANQPCSNRLDFSAVSSILLTDSSTSDLSECNMSSTHGNDIDNQESSDQGPTLGIDNLLNEFEKLKEVNCTLREQWNAAVNRSIDLDRRLMALEETERFDVSVQTDFQLVDCQEVSFPIEPKILVNTGCQSRLPDSHKCYKLTEEINGLKVKCMEYRSQLMEKDMDITELQTKLKSAVEVLKEFEQYSKDIENISSHLETELHIESRVHAENGVVVQKVQRVTVVADSHGRQVSTFLQEVLPGHRVSADIFPGAPYHCIANSAFSTFAREMFNKSDFLVVLGGSNSITNYATELNVNIFVNNIENLIRNCKGTNLILGTVPYRYDLNECSTENYTIRKLNEIIRCICRQNGIPFVEMWNLERKLHSRHGLHLNRLGKKHMTGIIASIIRGNCYKHSNYEHVVSNSKSEDRSSFVTEEEKSYTECLTDRSGPQFSSVDGFQLSRPSKCSSELEHRTDKELTAAPRRAHSCPLLSDLDECVHYGARYDLEHSNVFDARNSKKYFLVNN
jgi:hypothetical protein